MTDTISVRNESGQVTTFSVEGPDGAARLAILEQRIARGELEKVKKGAESVRPGQAAVVDADTGLKDEAGNYLRSVHGGGLDPDADGDVRGIPSGSKPVEGSVEVGGVSDAAVAQAEAKPQSEPAKKAAAKRANSQ